MKVDISRLKKGSSDVPTECRQLIDKLRNCTRTELLNELSQIKSWTFGKSELYHWIDILDIFDDILSEAAQKLDNIEWRLYCDVKYQYHEKCLLLCVLDFTTLLIEHSFSRHLYNSVDYLITLMSSDQMPIVISVLNLFYMFSKRSNFIPRLGGQRRNSLMCRLSYIAEVMWSFVVPILLFLLKFLFFFCVNI